MNKSTPKASSFGRSQLISAIADITKATKVDTEKFLDAFIKTVEGALKSGEEVRLIGFGTFCTTTRKATEGRNPRTGESIKIPERIVPKFRPGQKLKDSVMKK